MSNVYYTIYMQKLADYEDRVYKNFGFRSSGRRKYNGLSARLVS